MNASTLAGSFFTPPSSATPLATSTAAAYTIQSRADVAGPNPGEDPTLPAAPARNSQVGPVVRLARPRDDAVDEEPVDRAPRPVDPVDRRLPTPAPESLVRRSSHSFSSSPGIGVTMAPSFAAETTYTALIFMGRSVSAARALSPWSCAWSMPTASHAATISSADSSTKTPLGSRPQPWRRRPPALRRRAGWIAWTWARGSCR